MSPGLSVSPSICLFVCFRTRTYVGVQDKSWRWRCAVDVEDIVNNSGEHRQTCGVSISHDGLG